MLEFHKDDIIKIEYDKEVIADHEELEAVGATKSTTLRTLDFTPDDTNSIFVSKTGDDGNPGTEAEPVLTIERANQLVTAGKSNIVITDSGEYEENSINFSAHLTGIFAALGETPKIVPDPQMILANYFFEVLKDKTQLSIAPTPTGTLFKSIRLKALSNGDFVLVYDTGDGIHFIIYNADGNAKTSAISTGLVNGNESAFPLSVIENYFIIGVTNASGAPAKIFKNNGEALANIDTPASNARQPIAVDFPGISPNKNIFAMIYSVPTGVGIRVLDTEGKSYINYKVLPGTHYYTANYQSEGLNVIPNPNGGCIFGLREMNNVNCFWGVVNKEGNLVHYQHITNCRDLNVFINKNRIAVITTLTSDWVNRIAEFSLDDYSVIQPFTAFPEFGTAYTLNSSIDILHDGNIALTRVNNETSSPNDKSSFILMTPNYEVLYNETINDSRFTKIAYSPKSSRVAIAWKNTTSSPYYFFMKIYSGFLSKWWDFNSPSIKFNGVTFDNNNSYLYRYINFLNGTTCDFKWCSFQNIIRGTYYDTKRYPLPISTLSGDTSILNCKFFSNESGFKIQSNTCVIEKSQFLKHFNNPAVTIDGTAGIINHCDFLYNKIGVWIENNNGTEIIKNCIFYKNINADIEVEIPIELNHSIFTGVLVNASLGAKVLQVNPLYINDGFNDITKLNLNLRRKLFGYLTDSAGISLADDGNDVGSMKINISGVVENWKSITIPKGFIKVSYEPVGAISNIFDSGRMKSQKRGVSEVVEIDWSKGLGRSEIKKLIALNYSDDSNVRIYFQPKTKPLEYNNYTFEYDKVSLDPGANTLSVKGSKGVKMTFTRKFEVIE